jgi:hypothetical protein
MIHLNEGYVLDYNLLHPSIILVPIICADRVARSLYIPSNVISDVAIDENSLHSLLPFVPVCVCQMVMV